MAALSGPCRFRRLPAPSSWEMIFFSLRDVLCPNVFIAACTAAASRVPRAGLLRSDACVSADSDPSTPRATRSNKRARSCQGCQSGLAVCGAVLRPASRALLGSVPLPEASCHVDDGFEAHVSARRVPLSGRLCPREPARWVCTSASQLHGGAVVKQANPGARKLSSGRAFERVLASVGSGRFRGPQAAGAAGLPGAGKLSDNSKADAWN